MLRQDLLHRNVPRPEHDQRAREARLRLERLEQLLRKRPVAARLHYLRFARIFGRAATATGRGDETAGSMSDPRPRIFPAFLSWATEIPI